MEFLIKKYIIFLSLLVLFFTSYLTIAGEQKPIVKSDNNLKSKSKIVHTLTNVNQIHSSVFSIGVKRANLFRGYEQSAEDSFINFVDFYFKYGKRLVPNSPLLVEIGFIPEATYLFSLSYYFSESGDWDPGIELSVLFGRDVEELKNRTQLFDQDEKKAVAKKVATFGANLNLVLQKQVTKDIYFLFKTGVGHDDFIYFDDFDWSQIFYLSFSVRLGLY